MRKRRMEKQEFIINRAHELYLQSAYARDLYNCCEQAIKEILTEKEIFYIQLPFHSYVNHIKNEVMKRVNGY